MSGSLKEKSYQGIVLKYLTYIGSIIDRHIVYVLSFRGNLVSGREQVRNVVVAVKYPGVTEDHGLLNSVYGNVESRRIPQEVWAKHNQKVFYRHFVVDFLGDNFLQKLKQILDIVSVGLRQFPQQKFNFSDPLKLVLHLVNSPPFICIFCAEKRIWQLPADSNIFNS